MGKIFKHKKIVMQSLWHYLFSFTTGMLCTSFSALAADTSLFDGAFPEGLKAEVIISLTHLTEKERKHQIFKLNEVGQPTLLINDTLLTLKSRKGEKVIPPFKVAGVRNIHYYAWMHDGTLLIISGKRLGGLTTAGFKEVLTLPGSNMKVESASAELCYLYGGDHEEQRRNLYLYKKGGKLLHLLKAPEPITAVAGNGSVTFAAIGDSIFLLAAGKPIKLVYTAENEVTSLALTQTTAGIFFTTRDSVGYLYDIGKGFLFVRGKAAEVKVSGEHLYIFFPGVGVVNAMPIVSFESLVKTMESQPEIEKEEQWVQ